MEKESVYYKAIKGKSIMGTEDEVPELFKVAQNRGIQLPSPHLAIFKTVYAKIEEANRNDVRLEKSAVHEAMPTLIGKQVNLNHWRKGFICGHIIDANINAQEEIEVTFIFYKDVYIEDFDRAVDQFKKGDLTVSFELYAEDREDVGDGTVRLLSIDFAGMGLLLDEQPAYPGAVVFEMAKKFKQRVQESTSGLLFAKEITETCDKIIVALAKKYEEDTKNSDNIDEATHHNEDEKKKNKKDKKLKKKNNEEGGDNMPKLTAKQIKALKAELGDLCKDWTEEDFDNETKVAEARAIVADVEDQTNEESSEDEAVAEASAEETDEAKVTETLKETKEIEVVSDEDSQTMTEKIERKSEVKFEDDGSEKVEEVAEEASEETASEEVEDEASEEEADESVEEVKEDVEEAEEKPEDAEEKEEESTEAEESVEEEADEVEEATEEAEDTTEEVEEPVEEVVEESQDEELKAKIEELEKALEEANAKYTELEASIEDIKANALKIAEYQRVLGEYVKDFSEVDFLNPDKIRIAEQAKEIDELKGKKQDEVTPEVAADTGHDAEEVESANVKDPVRKLIDLKTSKKR